jgi:hypothetical protein
MRVAFEKVSGHRKLALERNENQSRHATTPRSPGVRPEVGQKLHIYNKSLKTQN